MCDFSSAGELHWAKANMTLRTNVCQNFSTPKNISEAKTIILDKDPKRNKINLFKQMKLKSLDFLDANFHNFSLHGNLSEQFEILSTFVECVLYSILLSRSCPRPLYKHTFDSKIDIFAKSKHTKLFSLSLPFLRAMSCMGN